MKKVLFFFISNQHSLCWLTKMMKGWRSICCFKRRNRYVSGKRYSEPYLGHWYNTKTVNQTPSCNAASSR